MVFLNLLNMTVLIFSLVVCCMLATSHPFLMVFLLITLTFMMSFFLWNLLYVPWLIMIMLMILLGGLLIIFTYVSAMVPNEITLMKKNWFILLWSPLFWISFQKFSNSGLNMETLTYLSVFKYSSFVVFLLIYLLVCLCACLLMSSKIKSPLKQKGY